MSSMDNYGVIDVSRRLWENAVGFIEPVRATEGGVLLCPLCRARQVEAALEQQPQSSDLSCENRHTFISAELDD